LNIAQWNKQEVLIKFDSKMGDVFQDHLNDFHKIAVIPELIMQAGL